LAISREKRLGVLSAKGLSEQPRADSKHKNCQQPHRRGRLSDREEQKQNAKGEAKRQNHALVKRRVKAGNG
jgi:hypothetical protein